MPQGSYALLALGTAVTTAVSGLMMSGAFAGASVMTVTRWNVACTLLMHGLAATLLGRWGSLDAASVRLLLISGTLAITIAAPAYYGSIALLGPRPGVLVFSLNAPLTFLIGSLLLGERPGVTVLAGSALVLAGVAIATWPRSPDMRTDAGRLGLGIGLGLVAALGQAGGTIAARPAMVAGADPFAAMAVRFGIAAIPLLAMQATPLSRVFKIHADRWRPLSLTAAGSLAGNGIGMTLLLVALAHANAGACATLAAASPVMILPMVWAQGGRRPGAPAWAGAAATLAGTWMVLSAT